MCQEYAKIYKANAAIMLEGDYYRLSNPYEQNAYTAWMHVSKDKTKAGCEYGSNRKSRKCV